MIQDGATWSAQQRATALPVLPTLACLFALLRIGRLSLGRWHADQRFDKDRELAMMMVMLKQVRLPIGVCP